MKNYEDPRLLAHTQQVDRERRAQAALRAQHQRHTNAQMIQRVAGGAR